MIAKKYTEDVKACKHCGKRWLDHQGIQPLCLENQKLKLKLMEVTMELDRALNKIVELGAK